MARRRKRRLSRQETMMRLILLLAIIATFLVGGIVTYFGGHINLTTFVILIIVFMVVFATIGIVFSLPVVKGKIGEAKVSSRLKKLAKRNGGQVFDNIMIPGENEKTSQIDHIYVCSYGVFVVETKNYAGRIYGNDEQKFWKQVLAYGHRKNELYNPVKQNQTHIIRLKENLDLDISPISAVVFVRSNTDYIKSDYVYNIGELKYLLEGLEKTLEDSEIETISKAITEYKLHPVKTDREHVKEIRQMKRDIANNICPRCGAELVLRHGKSGDFYGCSNFPKCTFTKKK